MCEWYPALDNPPFETFGKALLPPCIFVTKYSTQSSVSDYLGLKVLERLNGLCSAIFRLVSPRTFTAITQRGCLQ